MKKTVRVGVIGCGRIAQLAHLPLLARLPGAELVAFAEPDSRRRQEASRIAPHATAFAEFEALLDQVDSVVICLPTALHAETAMAALERGKHVYLEKPLATNLDDAKKVMDAWKRAQVVGMLGFNYRFNKLYASLRERSASLGRLLAARTVFSTAAKDMPEWKRTRASGGGVLFDLAPHHFDLVRYFFGCEVVEVHARITSRSSEGDSAFVEMQLANGMAVQSLFSMSGVEEDSFEVFGDMGKAAVNRYRSLAVETFKPTLGNLRLEQLCHGLRSLAGAPYLVEKIRAAGNEPSYAIALSKFVAAVRDGRPVAPDFVDGYRNVAIIDAVARSAATGYPVQLSGSLPDFEQGDLTCALCARQGYR